MDSGNIPMRQNSYPKASKRLRFNFNRFDLTGSMRSCKENKQNSFSLLFALVRVYGLGYLSKSMLPRPQNLIRTVFFLFLNFAAPDRFVYISASRSLFRETQQTCTLLSSLLLFHTLKSDSVYALLAHAHINKQNITLLSITIFI